MPSHAVQRGPYIATRAQIIVVVGLRGVGNVTFQESDGAIRHQEVGATRMRAAGPLPCIVHGDMANIGWRLHGVLPAAVGAGPVVTPDAPVGTRRAVAVATQERASDAG